MIKNVKINRNIRIILDVSKYINVINFFIRLTLLDMRLGLMERASTIQTRWPPPPPGFRTIVRFDFPRGILRNRPVTTVFFFVYEPTVDRDLSNETVVICILHTRRVERWGRDKMKIRIFFLLAYRCRYEKKTVFHLGTGGKFAISLKSYSHWLQ